MQSQNLTNAAGIRLLEANHDAAQHEVRDRKQLSEYSGLRPISSKPSLPASCANVSGFVINRLHVNRTTKP